MIRSGSICLSLLYKYLMSTNEEVNDTTSNGKILIKKATKLECLSETFKSYGGVLAKLSQIVCLENEDNSVFSECEPFSTDKTIKYLKNEFENNPEYFKNIKMIDFNPFKSGSIGQVHKGIYIDNKEIIIKVQYVGLKEQMETDLYILDKLVSYLYNFSNLTDAMIDIKKKLNEELDYTLEFYNQKNIYDLWNHHQYIKIAEVIPDISNEKMLGMYYIDAENLPSFIDNSTQGERNKIGMLIVEFIFTNLYKHGIFYSDIHYGNFLIKNKSILYVMDFGCIHYIEPDLLENLKNLHRSILNNDSKTFYNIVIDLGIINDETISLDSKKYLYDYIKLQMEPWLSNNFKFSDDWLEKAVYKNVDLMKEWKLPPNMVYLNKICYGFPHVLKKLQLEGNFLHFFQNIL